MSIFWLLKNENHIRNGQRPFLHQKTLDIPTYLSEMVYFWPNLAATIVIKSGHIKKYGLFHRTFIFVNQDYFLQQLCLLPSVNFANAWNFFLLSDSCCLFIWQVMHFWWVPSVWQLPTETSIGRRKKTFALSSFY